MLAATGAMAAGAAAAAAETVRRQRARRRKRERRFRLEPGEPVSAGIRRIALGQIDLVADALSDGARDGGPSDVAIHDARKALKRLRALLRLAREELGPDVRARENAAFRDAGRRLSGARDAAVLADTLDELVRGGGEAVPGGAFGGLRAALAASAGGPAPADVTAVQAAMAAARERVEAWPLPEPGEPAALAAGLRRIQRRGRRAAREASDEPDAEHLHELRKRTKDLWHAGQVLRPAQPKAMRAISRRAHDLSDLLGTDHDLAMLLAAARERPETLAAGEPELLETLVEQRRAALRDDALARARKLYARKPRAVAALVS
jgi:CHAD domain-containing protein